MCSVPTELIAAQRARWLAEVSDVLEEARRLLTRLSLEGETSAEAHEAYLKIEAACLEVQSLRLGRSLRQRVELGPKWIGSSPWQSNHRHLG